MISLGPRIDRKMTICSSYHGHYFNSLRAAAQNKRALKDFVCVCLLAARAAACLCADPACSLILSLFSSPPLPAPGCNSGIDGTASLREAGPSSALLTSAPLPPPPASPPTCSHPTSLSQHALFPSLLLRRTHFIFAPNARSDPFGGSYHPPRPARKGEAQAADFQTERPFSPRIA